MSEYICFLITFVQLSEEWGNKLIKVALRVHRGQVPSDAIEYPREYEELLRDQLPAHCRSLGPIVDVEVIFEVHDAGPKASCYIDYTENHVDGITTITAMRPGSDRRLAIGSDKPLYDQLMQLAKELP